MSSLGKALLLVVLLGLAGFGVFLMLAGHEQTLGPPKSSPPLAVTSAPPAEPPVESQPVELPPPPSEPLVVGGDVSAPVKRSGDDPTYTEIAQRARVQGVVVVRAAVLADGTVGDVQVLKGLPMGLDEQAVQAVRTWRFEPGKKNGEPVVVWTTLTLNFRL